MNNRDTKISLVCALAMAVAVGSFAWASGESITGVTSMPTTITGVFTATGANVFGASGVTTTFTAAATDATILDGAITGLSLLAPTVDASAAGALTVGAGTATSVDISATGEMTTFKGTVNVDEAVTFDTTLVVTTSVASPIFDAAGAGALVLGAATATSVDISATTEVTTLKGLLNVDEAATFDTTLGVTGVSTFTGGSVLPDDARAVIGTGGDTFLQGETTTLTDASASTVFSIVSADGDMGGVTITYTIQATDGSEYQSIQNVTNVATVDDAGGVVATVVVGTAPANAVSSGTLAETSWGVVTTDDQSLEVQLTATSSLTTSSFIIRWTAVASGDVTLVVP